MSRYRSALTRNMTPPRGLIAPDDGSVVARLEQSLRDAGWVVERTVEGANVVVRLSTHRAAPNCYRFTGPTAIDAVRLAAEFALVSDG